MHISEILKTKNFPLSNSPRLDLELLLEKSLHKPRSFLYKNTDYELSSKENKTFEALCLRREKGEPVAYILGKKEFWSREFVVNDKVLIPRPETELLVEIILDQISFDSVDVVDLGTGSGAIALTLAKEKPNWQVVATDISADALQVASYNAMQLDIQNIEFYCGDWCNILPARKFDLIVSNPPYIKENDPYLEKEDLLFEPKIALEAGDGMEALKIIILQAKERLKEGGVLVLEHGYDQSAKVKDLLQQHGYKNIVSYKDLAGLDRAVMANLRV